MNKKFKLHNKIIRLSISLIIFSLGFSGCNNNIGSNSASSNSATSGFKIGDNPTITGIHQALGSHQISCEGVINQYLNRIKRYNLVVSGGKAPLNAISEINSSVIDDAKQLDLLYAKTGKMPGAMFCIPVLIKDSIDVKNMTSAAGSYALLGAMPQNDAPLVGALRDANAIILGKTTMNEFGFFQEGGRNGLSGNAYDPMKYAGGSSTGSAVGVAANLAVASVGVDSGGSIRVPAALNGVYGMHPTYGLIDGSGSFNMQPLTTVPGPMARTVADLAIELSVLASTTQSTPINYASSLNKEGMKGKRIGLINSIDGVNLLNVTPDMA